MIQFKCIYCGEEMEAPQSIEGEKLDCPNCSHRVPVPRSRTGPEENRSERTSDSKICSECLNAIPSKASKCPYCGKSLATPQVGAGEMLVRFDCSKCGGQVKVPVALKGQVVKCTHCGLHETVPQNV
jgi:DNA-directed RNA polymerase subunit RPC12/RpoP/ribosomal protein L40E